MDILKAKKRKKNQILDFTTKVEFIQHKIDQYPRETENWFYPLLAAKDVPECHSCQGDNDTFKKLLKSPQPNIPLICNHHCLWWEWFHSQRTSWAYDNSYDLAYEYARTIEPKKPIEKDNVGKKEHLEKKQVSSKGKMCFVLSENTFFGK